MLVTGPVEVSAAECTCWHSSQRGHNSSLAENAAVHTQLPVAAVRQGFRGTHALHIQIDLSAAGYLNFSGLRCFELLTCPPVPSRHPWNFRWCRAAQPWSCTANELKRDNSVSSAIKQHQQSQLIMTSIYTAYDHARSTPDCDTHMHTQLS